MDIVEPIKDFNDIQNIIRYLDKRSKMYSTIFQLGIHSGLRVSDILALNISDIKNKEYVVIHEKKTGKYKKFPLSKQLQDLLREYLKIREQNWSKDNKKPLFIGRKHCRLGRSQVYRFLNEACKFVGCKANIGTHSMRKTFGYHHYKQYNDVALLQKIFNHSSASITLRYIGILQEDIDNSYLNLRFFNIKDTENNKIKEKYKRENSVIEVLYNYCQNGGKYKDFAKMILEMA